MFPDNYNTLNWCVKTAILDPVRLKVWEIQNAPRIIPSEEDARKIGLDVNWKLYLEEV